LTFCTLKTFAMEKRVRGWVADAKIDEAVKGKAFASPTVRKMLGHYTPLFLGFLSLVLIYHELYPPIRIKSSEEIVKMRLAGNLASQVLTYVTPYVKAGISTGELDDLCHKYIVDVQHARPAPLNYRGFPKSTCTSINDVVCHGIPNYDEVLKTGDIINIDVTVVKDGFHGDTSKMFMVGAVDTASNNLVADTRAAMFEAIRMVRPGITTGDLGHAIQLQADTLKYGNVRDFTGHGTGVEFHEGPRVAHYGSAGWGATLKEGMTFTIEPMFNQGVSDTKIMADGWTAKTTDGRRSAQWEHTVLVTATGYEILTLRDEEEAEGIPRIGHVLPS